MVLFEACVHVKNLKTFFEDVESCNFQSTRLMAVAFFKRAALQKDSTLCTYRVPAGANDIPSFQLTTAVTNRR